MTETGPHASERFDFFRSLNPQRSKVFPGLALCGTIAMASTFLADHYDAPVMLFALLLGMAFNSVGETPTLEPGIALASKRLLRIGVALLGARMSLSFFAELGALPVVLAVAGICLSIGVGLGLAKVLGRTPAFGVLSGGAVGICGASAALALASSLPRGPRGIVERDVVFTVVSVTTLSTIAMIIYPMIARAIGLDDHQAGIFIGLTIHDVAQVVGAGFSVSEAAGETSTVVKLVRVSMLVPVVLATALAFRGRKDSDVDATSAVPLFLIGFLALVAANSLGLISASIQAAIVETSRWLLVIAIAGLGIRTRIADLMAVGPRAAIIVVTQTVVLAGFALACITLLT